MKFCVRLCIQALNSLKVFTHLLAERFKLLRRPRLELQSPKSFILAEKSRVGLLFEELPKPGCNLFSQPLSPRLRKQPFSHSIRNIWAKAEKPLGALFHRFCIGGLALRIEEGKSEI